MPWPFIGTSRTSVYINCIYAVLPCGATVHVLRCLHTCCRLLRQPPAGCPVRQPPWLYCRPWGPCTPPACSACTGHQRDTTCTDTGDGNQQYRACTGVCQFLYRQRAARMIAGQRYGGGTHKKVARLMPMPMLIGPHLPYCLAASCAFS